MTHKKKSNIRIVCPKGKVLRQKSGYTTRHASSGIFIGPSVDGPDEEYVKVLTGNVDRKKPSFA